MTALSTALHTRWQRSVIRRSPQLTTLTLSSIFSETASQFVGVALIWVVLVTTHSPADAGLVVLCRRIPEIISGPLLGPWFDRYAPVPLTALGYLVRGGTVAAIAVLSAVHLLSLPLLLVLCLFMGITNPLASVGSRVLIPRIVSTEDRQVANGVLSISDQFPYLVGPAMGGAMAGFAGTWALLVPAGMCLVALLLLIPLRAAGVRETPSGADSTPPPSGRSSWFGFKPMVTTPVVRAMMLLTILYYISYGPLLTAIPVFASTNLHSGGAGYGAMWSAMGLGALGGLVSIPRLAKRRPAVVNSVGAALWGVALLPLVVIHSLPAALVVMFVGGLVWAPYASTEIGVIQHSVPEDQHGAVFGARRSVIVSSSPTGAALGGVLLEHMTAVHVIGLSAVSCVAGGLICLALPSVRKTPPLNPAPDAAPAEEPATVAD
ncbi:MFS transporter [Streptacidiphilus jiangxiensis]|uniref:Predicted arabinose efflux permease, MFS family n=1 Tax=Streptacidiphilus jiangxiensis TaxID=235985 RepID=A0A1H7VMN1_STRJI|nr:MFS transporter [Streptacidiphilus jiangxiensis]SEM10159.1 Predicted arabinose efflux permease, MFS family [Streptacidiphilus jiangxiensis]